MHLEYTGVIKGEFMSRTYRILVVDDEPDLQPLILQRMRREIRNKIYKFEFAMNGIDALELLKQDCAFDLILADINMPRMDGLTLLKQVPRINNDIKSIVVSAYGDIKNIRRAMNAGAFDFITKPIDFADLRATIERTISHIEMWKEFASTNSTSVTLNAEHSIASRMQMSILPRKFPSGRNYELYGTVDPAKNIGGDFYDVFILENGLIGLAIADVSEKGIPAAMFMMSSRSLLKGAAIGVREPSDVLHEVNTKLIEGNEGGTFVTMLYCVFDPFTGKIKFANGGHCRPLILHSDGSYNILETRGGAALGMVDIIEFENSSWKLMPGDQLLLYTDGITMAENEIGELFGEGRLIQALQSSTNNEENNLDKTVIKSVKEFMGNTEMIDDITCMVLKFHNPLI